MAEQDAPTPPASFTPPRWLMIFLILGLYLTLRGYHSRDNDQAYRLPLLLHHQDPALFADDPFVRSFDAFNPHRGYLALLDVASRPLGLSAGLFLLFTLTFAATCIGFDRLARAVWPEAGAGRRSGRDRAGADGEGRQHRHGPPLRGDAARPPDRVCARLAGTRLGGRATRTHVPAARRWRSGWRRWCTHRSACNWRCSWGCRGWPGPWRRVRRGSIAGGRSSAWPRSVWPSCPGVSCTLARPRDCTRDCRRRSSGS